MKKIFIGMMLLSSINQVSYAQARTNNEYPFNIPPNSTNRHFWVDLGKGNRMDIYVNNTDDINLFKNMDSIIYGFLKDINHFKDSLSDERTIKRIDYNLDDAEKRKLRISQHLPAGQGFLVTDTDVASLKTMQDTINFIGKVDFVANYPLRKKFNDTRYYKITFLVNNVQDMSEYMNNILNKKIESLQQNITRKWDNNDDRSYSPIADQSIKANAVRGFNAGGDFLTIKASVDVQNYKATFVPSASLGFGVILGGKNIRREIDLFSEYHFSFSKNAAGNNRTHISQFLTFSYARGFIKDDDVRKNNYNLLNFSISYLIRNRGGLYEKNTSKITAGALQLFEGKTKIQPVLYIQGFFKSATPGIRWVQSF